MNDVGSSALDPAGSTPGCPSSGRSQLGGSDRGDFDHTGATRGKPGLGVAGCDAPDLDAPDLDAADLDAADLDAPDLDTPGCDAPALDTTALDAIRPRPRRQAVNCGDLPFVIKRDGTWLYRGSPIGRKELVCLFASVLRRDDDGGFWLETPVERGRIEVEDAPFVAVELDWTGSGPRQVLSFRTNVDQIVTAGPDHPIRISIDLITCEPTPYITVRPGAGRLAVEARIGRAVYYELVALAEPRWVGGRRVLGVWSSGKFFSLGDLPPGDS